MRQLLVRRSRRPTRRRPSTLAVTPAAADEVSVSIAHLFSQHAHDYQAQATQAAAFQGQFAQNLKAGAGAYSSMGRNRLVVAVVPVVGCLDWRRCGRMEGPVPTCLL
jgi:hypothetical protein